MLAIHLPKDFGTAIQKNGKKSKLNFCFKFNKKIFGFFYSVTPNSMPPEMNKPTPLTSVANRSKIPSSSSNSQDSPSKKNVSSISAKSDGKSEGVGSGGVGNGGSTAHGTSGSGTSANATSESLEKVTGKSKNFYTV